MLERSHRPPELILYTRADCHLCEEVKAQLQPLVREFGATLREVDVDADPELKTRFGEQVPVIFLDGRKVGKYRVDVKQFRRLLDRSRK
ncbi:MAG: glutaredoxin family protein [Terriglobia bacterium]